MLLELYNPVYKNIHTIARYASLLLKHWPFMRSHKCMYRKNITNLCHRCETLITINPIIAGLWFCEAAAINFLSEDKTFMNIYSPH